MEYKIVGATTEGGLVLSVGLNITKGWKPQGGISIGHTRTYGDSYYQAMIKD